MQYPLDKPIAKRDGLVFQERGDQTYVLTLGDTTLHHLGEVETFIWRLLDGRRTAKDIVGLVCSEYAVEETRALEDVQSFLSSLEAAGLVSMN